MTGGLFDPLGTNRAEPARSAARPSAPVVLAGLALAAIAALVAVSYLRDDGDRGRPVAIAPIEHVAAPPKPPVPLPAPAASATPAAAPASPDAPPASRGLPPVRDDQEVEIQNGVRIIRPRRATAAPGGATVVVPGAPPAGAP